MSSNKLPRAYIKHQLSGRVRIKIPKKRGNYQYFDEVADAFADCKGITQLQLNPSAASILVQHDDNTTLSAIAEHARHAGLFKLIEDHDSKQLMKEHLSIAGWSAVGVTHLDQSITRLSDGRLDLRTFWFLSFVGFAINEASKGHIFAPATTFLWRAMELLKPKNDNMYGTSKR